MSPKSLSGTPAEASRESTGINEVIDKLKTLLGEAITPKIEEGLHKLTKPTLQMLEALLNPNTNGTQALMLSRFATILNNK